MRVLHPTVVCAVLLLGFARSVAAAQGNYEVQVYGAPTMVRGTTMFELHSNFTFQGSKGIGPDGSYGSNHALHETIEITHGLTSWSELGIYCFTSVQPGAGIKWVGSHIRPRVRIPDSWNWPVGVSLSTEFGYQRAAFSADTWTWEIRPIIDKTMGAWYVAFNPAMSRAWKGPGTTRGVEFEPNVKIGYDVTKQINAGIEYYGAMGKIGDFNPSTEQEHIFFGAVDLDVSPDWEINFGMGVGVTTPTDHLLFKLILGRRVSWGRK